MSDHSWDRTTHARRRSDGMELARYDRSGKWYLEASDGRRLLVNLTSAVAFAVPNVTYFDRPGGRIFDARVRAVRSALGEES